jgi:hypothetical protein
MEPVDPLETSIVAVSAASSAIERLPIARAALEAERR